MSGRMIFQQYAITSTELNMLGEDGLNEMKRQVKWELSSKIPLDELGLIREDIRETRQEWIGEDGDFHTGTTTIIRYIWEPLTEGARQALINRNKKIFIDTMYGRD